MAGDVGCVTSRVSMNVCGAVARTDMNLSKFDRLGLKQTANHTGPKIDLGRAAMFVDDARTAAISSIFSGNPSVNPGPD